MKKKVTDYVGSFAKGLKIIESFGADKRKLSITEAAKISGLDHPAARRYLLTLLNEGYADFDGKFFSLTPKTLRLGMSALVSLPLPNIVQPWLERLSEVTGQSFSVSILDSTEIVYIARASQKKVFSINLYPGSRLPAYCTSMGRVFLAHMPEKEASKILLLSNLLPRTAHTLTSHDTILEELVKVKEWGYATVDQEVELGLRSLAVPVLDIDGQCLGALNVGVSASVYSVDDLISGFLPKMLTAQLAIKKILKKSVQQ